MLDQWDGINHAQATGTGLFGNQKTGRYEYGSNCLLGFTIDKTGTTCTMNNSAVKPLTSIAAPQVARRSVMLVTTALTTTA